MSESKPFKVVLFANAPLSAPILNFLLQKKWLAGVVLTGTDMASMQMANWLQQQTLPWYQFQPNNLSQLSEQLSRWEADIGLTFGFDPKDLKGSMPENSRFGLWHFSPNTPYWAIRKQQTELALRLYQDEKKSVSLGKLDIHPMDTTNCLDNQLNAHAPALLASWLESKSRDEAAECEETASAFQPEPTEADLKVHWSRQDANEIAAMIRAGNSRFGGGIVTINKTPLSLLQASPIDFPTYGVTPGTLCHTGEPDGVIVACKDGAVRLDILSNADGVFTALAFCERFQIYAGMEFSDPGK